MPKKTKAEVARTELWNIRFEISGLQRFIADLTVKEEELAEIEEDYPRAFRQQVKLAMPVKPRLKYYAGYLLKITESWGELAKGEKSFDDCLSGIRIASNRLEFVYDWILREGANSPVETLEEVKEFLQK